MYRMITTWPGLHKGTRIVFTSMSQFDTMALRLERMGIPFEVSESEDEPGRSEKEVKKARMLANKLFRMYEKSQREIDKEKADKEKADKEKADKEKEPKKPAQPGE